MQRLVYVWFVHSWFSCLQTELGSSCREKIPMCCWRKEWTRRVCRCDNRWWSCWAHSSTVIKNYDNVFKIDRLIHWSRGYWKLRQSRGWVWFRAAVYISYYWSRKSCFVVKKILNFNILVEFFPCPLYRGKFWGK